MAAMATQVSRGQADSIHIKFKRRQTDIGVRSRDSVLGGGGRTLRPKQENNLPKITEQVGCRAETETGTQVCLFLKLIWPPD